MREDKERTPKERTSAIMLAMRTVPGRAVSAPTAVTGNRVLRISAEGLVNPLAHLPL
ncbi:Protein of unknown function [Gryllus bimaculatus]|nr:Protein of unknown function [Gryllus bimaculatus]